MVLIKTVDEIYTDATISEQTWSKLKKEYNDEQLMDIVITIGEYYMVSLILNSIGVELDVGVTGFPIN